MTRSHLQKSLLVIVLVAVILAFFLFDLGQYASLEYLKASQARFLELYKNHTLAVLGGYMGAYILMAALSLPGAAVFTLAGGALFGFWIGLVAASVSSTLGAVLACAVSRYLLRDMVQTKFETSLKKINQGIEREGAFYLFTLRLIPVFPFFVINLALGVSHMRLWTFYWVSQIGMLPGAAVYVNAGKELGQLETLSGILSPGLIGSFALLGLFPLVAKKGVAFLRARRQNSSVNTE
ncbi:TVP38/TMEM64 family protein [Desulfohalobium retbaense]|uniref:TVP38/TMEM64 family membrane protein n=1 Tax=Desulfohalobium retbaense (strain ATCC 49708 / DSM 5692 / JCM 16813 / HR100) TaxID=485915 RepID=C8X207_DESRD|nr:TVP38/TMEM64 family protein [Desulfohalobium retbaense]ACV68330.1 SNARE associated Golgi protein related protein [Desulfohalobium retbaense DSM 5692]